MRQLFLSNFQINRSFSADAAVSLFIVFIALQRVHETFFRKHNKISGKIFHKGSITYLTVIHVAVVLLSFSEYFNRQYVDWPVCLIGIIFYMFAYIVRKRAIGELGRFHSIHIELRGDDHPVVETGPYRYVRHPIYAVTVLELLSIPMIANSLIGFMVATFFYMPGLVFRVVREDEILRRVMGKNYEMYRLRTPMLIPNLKKLLVG
jgi:protein-S-isoprenylcysteine O-methyltransferase Ste14